MNELFAAVAALIALVVFSAPVKLDRWIDSNTSILYASLRQVAARRDDPGEMYDGFGADLLFTLKFDEAGNWKIIKTHEMSEKEVENREKEQ